MTDAYNQLADTVSREIAAASDVSTAMERAVATLKARLSHY